MFEGSRCRGETPPENCAVTHLRQQGIWHTIYGDTAWFLGFQIGRSELSKSTARSKQSYNTYLDARGFIDYDPIEGTET